MPSLEAPRPVDILVWVPADILLLEPVALVWVPACALAPAPAFCPFSTAQEGVAAAKDIAPTTPSMSGSFITALFMVAPPVLRPAMGHSRHRNLAVGTRFLSQREDRGRCRRARPLPEFAEQMFSLGGECTARRAPIARRPKHPASMEAGGNGARARPTILRLAPQFPAEAGRIRQYQIAQGARDAILAPVMPSWRSTSSNA